MPGNEHRWRAPLNGFLGRVPSMKLPLSSPSQFFLSLVACGAHLPRSPVEASFLALSSLQAHFLYHNLLGKLSGRRASDWRLRCTGRRLASAIAGDYLLFVSTFRPMHPSLFSPTGDPSKPGTGTTHLFYGGAGAHTRNLRPVARTSPRRDEAVVPLDYS